MRYIVILLLSLPLSCLAVEKEAPASMASFLYENIATDALESPQPGGQSDSRSINIEALRIQNEISKRDMAFAMSQLDSEFWYVTMLGAMCVVTLLISLAFLARKEHYASKDLVNVIGLTLIIYGTIILVLVVQTSEQLTAAIGILGAIAGYLFRSVQESAREGSLAKKPPRRLRENEPGATE
ncbi:MAG TPA: hypothetical protein ENK35_06185 [Candidatus Tenderia sp.]|nr:hypothetical protein [Candidatus Tenderia sp.]